MEGIEKAAHLCIDMQNIFAPGGPWETPWMERVLPAIEAIAARYREHTIFPASFLQITLRIGQEDGVTIFGAGRKPLVGSSRAPSLSLCGKCRGMFHQPSYSTSPLTLHLHGQVFTISWSASMSRRL